MKNLLLMSLRLATTFSLTFTSCGFLEDAEDLFDETLFIEMTQPDDSYTPGQIITASINLDASTGFDANASNYTVYWELSGPGTITYNGQDYANQFETSSNQTSIQFSGVANGSYSVNVRIEMNGLFSTTASNYTVSGSISPTSNDLNNIEFKDVITTDYEGTEPDYIFEGDVTINSATFPDNGRYIVIGLSENASVTINGNLDLNGNYLFFIGNNNVSWKGVHLQSGSFNNGYVYIHDAGSGSILDYDPAALVVNQSSFNGSSTYYTFKNTTGYDLYLSNDVTYISNEVYYEFSSDTPVYAPVSLWPYIRYDYLENKTLTLESNPDVQYSFDGATLYMAGDVRIHGSLQVQNSFALYPYTANSSIIMDADASLIAHGGINVQSGGLNFRAVDDTPWAGIYLGSASLLTDANIINAGSMPISSNSVSGLSTSAAIYLNANASLSRLQSCTVSGSGGYGLYVEGYNSLSPNKDYFTYNTFSDNAKAAVSVDQYLGGVLSGTTNTYTTPADVAAIEIRQGTQGIANNMDWLSLGEGNFYEFTGNFTVTTNLRLGGGVHMKFGPSKGFYFEPAGTYLLDIEGTINNPVTIEGVGTSKWIGLIVGKSSSSAKFNADYLTLKNAGSGTPIGYTQSANLIVKTNLGTAPTTDQFSITNSTFEGSDGYGVYIDGATSFSYDPTNVTFNNTFTNNTSGDYRDDTLQ
ncbi:MAG: hypothetical protein OCD76_17600 [Reichenbachiella sp.]